MKYDLEADVIWTDGLEEYETVIKDVYYRHNRQEEKEVTWALKLNNERFHPIEGDDKTVISFMKKHNLYVGRILRHFYIGDHLLNLVVCFSGKDYKDREYRLVHANSLEVHSTYDSFIKAIQAAYAMGCLPMPVVTVPEIRRHGDTLKLRNSVASQDVHNQVRGIHHNSSNNDYPFPGENYNVDGTGTEVVPWGGWKK